MRFAPNAALDADDIAHQLALPVITNAVDLSFPVIFNSLLGRTFGGLVPSGKNQHGRVTAERSSKHLGALNAQPNPIALDGRQRRLRNATELRELVLAESLKLSDDAYRFAYGNLRALLGRTKILHVHFLR